MLERGDVELRAQRRDLHGHVVDVSKGELFANGLLAPPRLVLAEHCLSQDIEVEVYPLRAASAGMACERDGSRPANTMPANARRKRTIVSGMTTRGSNGAEAGPGPQQESIDRAGYGGQRLPSTMSCKRCAARRRSGIRTTSSVSARRNTLLAGSSSSRAMRRCRMRSASVEFLFASMLMARAKVLCSLDQLVIGRRRHHHDTSTTRACAVGGAPLGSV
jgi:hypothetical protein